MRQAREHHARSTIGLLIVVMLVGLAVPVAAGAVTDLITASIKVRSADPVEYENLGFSVARDGNTILAGAPKGTGVSAETGIVCVYVPNTVMPAFWSRQSTLKAPDGVGGDGFGHSVAISGDTAVIGAPYDNPGGLSNAGSAYVYVRSGTTWTFQRKLTATDKETGAYFGRSIAIDDDTIIVGAPLSQASAPGGGAAYVYVRSGSTWSEQTQLLPSDPQLGDQFGRAVDISGDYVVVGAPEEDTRGADAGASYVFGRSGISWSQKAKLTDTDGREGDLFGWSVGISGTTAIISAPWDDDLGDLSGSAFIFRRQLTPALTYTWARRAKLHASDGAAGNWFGYSVDIDGVTAVVGAPTDNDKGPGSGSAYAFTANSSGVWNERRKIIAADGADNDRFGTAVAVSGSGGVFGSPYDDDSAEDGGFAYIRTVNYAPSAAADSYAATAGSAKTVSAPGVLANDSDSDGDPITAVKVTGPAHGTLTLGANGSFTYTPAVGYAGVDSFTYKAYDNALYSAAKTVTFTVKSSTTLSLSAPSVSAYRSARLAGRLYDSAGKTVGNKPVLLEYSADGVTWKTLATVYTAKKDSKGWLYEYTAKPSKKTHYRARFAGDSSYYSDWGPTRTVLPKVYLTRPSLGRTTLTYGTTYKARGYLKPRHKAGTYPVKIAAYRYSSGKYRYVKTYSAKAFDYSSYTKYVKSIKLPSKGKWRLRAVHPADSLNAKTYSSYRYVTVK